MDKKNKISRIFAYLLHQIWNERRSNWALLAELLIVSSIIWYLVDSMYVVVVRGNEPLGFDFTNCYQFNIGQLDSKAVDYDPSHPDSADIEVADKLELIDRVRHLEDIEVAAYSLSSGPFNASAWVNGLKYDTLEFYPSRIVCCQPDFLRVFRIGGTDGKSPEQMAGLLKPNTILLSDYKYYETHETRELLGKELTTSFSGDYSLRYRMVGLVSPLKRLTWDELLYSNVAVFDLSNEMISRNKISEIDVRVKANRMQGFEERMRELIKDKKLRVGNYYISNAISYDQKREASEGQTDRQQRFVMVAMSFLLLNVFFGLLGTFWFRTQHRFSEIGLQKAFGATNVDIVFRLLAEAVLLMTIAFVPSLLIDLNIAYMGLTERYQDVTLATGRFITCAVVTYLLLLLIIVLGIWFPAQRAMKANPVEVLRGE